MPFLSETTIVAISTPPGYGAIGLIRLSGPKSLTLVDCLIDPLKQFSPVANRATFHQIIHPDTLQPLDDAVITYFQAPHSFTGEDVIEIACHGSPVVLSEVVNILVTRGAEFAQPGEFSMRAFLNQRMDLAQAEAINDLIHAQTRFQAQIAVRQLHGELSKQIKALKDSIVEIVVFFESSVEFVEDDLAPLEIKRFSLKIEDLISSINYLISSYRVGRLYRTGIKLALIGRPNVGKSSVFNKLLGRDRAIVTDIPGTTRDVLADTFSIKGIPVELIDTAGIRETEDILEKLGVERTQSALADADFVIAVIEANKRPDPDEISFLQQIPYDLLILNKSDLGCILHEEFSLTSSSPLLPVSALTGEGIDELRDLIYQTLTSGIRHSLEGGIITNLRHLQSLESAISSLIDAQLDLKSGCSEEIVLVNLHSALKSLGIITGETLIGDIINQIFSTFCIGK